MSDLKVKLILELMDKITSPVKRLADNFTQASIRMMHSAEKLRKKVSEIGDAATKVGQALSVSITAPITAIGYAAIKQSAQFEKLKASLETVTGSQLAAGKAWEEILKFASTTPYSLEEVMGSFIKLKALGLDPSMDSLRSFGNTASAMGKSLDQFIEAVADASTGEFERLKEFGIKAKVEGKKVSFTFQGQTTVIKNSAEEIQKYLKKIGEVQFAGAMDKQMRKLSGAFSNFSDSVSTSLSKVGDAIIANLDLKQFTLDISNSITKLAEKFQALPQWMQGFIIKGGLILAVVGPLIMFIAQFAIGIASLIYTFTLLSPALIATMALFKAFSLALLTTPIGWILLGITALAAAAFLIIKNWDVVSEFFSGVWVSIKSIFDDGVQYVMRLLEPLLKAIDLVKRGVSFATNSASNPVVASVPNLNSPSSSSAAAGSAAPPSVLRQKVDTGGTLHIKIDSEGKSKTIMARPNDNSMDWTVDTGLLMGTP